MVSEGCIYLKSDDTQIWLDYGTDWQRRDFYIYEKNELTFFDSYFGVSIENRTIGVFNNNGWAINKGWVYKEGAMAWPYEKNDEYSIKINGKVFCINKDDTKQLELFNELLEDIFRDNTEEINHLNKIIEEGIDFSKYTKPESKTEIEKIVDLENNRKLYVLKLFVKQNDDWILLDETQVEDTKLNAEFIEKIEEELAEKKLMEHEDVSYINTFPKDLLNMLDQLHP
jgi:hypothetical protein